MNFTQGKWEITPEEYSHNIGTYRCIISDVGLLIAHVWPDSNPQTDANAHLISAAPEMYKALYIALNETPDKPLGKDVRLIMKQALAKAEENE